jgi:sugar lactone lactonase YvrE
MTLRSFARFSRSLTLLFVAALALASATQAAETYELDRDYSAKLPEGLQFGSVPGIAFDSQENLIVSHRGPRPILVYDKSGKLIHMFGDDELTAVHGTRVDADDNIWVTDHRNHTVIKYSPAGKVLMLLGKRDVKGEDAQTFNRPTDVAFGKDGDFFVSDGYGNNRVVKFRKDGTFVKAWGTKGKAEGEFTLPHCVQIDAQGQLHVADRENDRVQVFTQDGQFVRKYGGFAPFGLFIAPDQTLFVADGRAHKCLHTTLEGKVLGEWGSQGTEPGQFNLPHGIAVDRQGRIYVGDIEGKRLQRFTRKGA